MTSPFLGKGLGTMTMIVLGDGVAAGVLLKQSRAEGAGRLAITAAWGIAVMYSLFVATATGSPDAYLNPAITLASVVMGDRIGKLWVYIPAQLLGGFLGAIVVWLHYLPHWRLTEDAALKLGVFCTGPAIRDCAGGPPKIAVGESLSALTRPNCEDGIWRPTLIRPC